jgi:hypothetical protein
MILPSISMGKRIVFLMLVVEFGDQVKTATGKGAALPPGSFVFVLPFTA